MARSFLGTGWAYPIRTNKRGGHKLASDEEDIKQACKIILGTALGERAMRPDFGCIVHELLFEVADDALLGKVEFYITNTLLRWEPRIKVTKVEAEFSQEQLHIYIEYIIRKTNSQDNLVVSYNRNNG